MFLRFCMAMLAILFLWTGQAPSGHGGRWAAGPINLRRSFMDQDNKVPGAPEPTTPTATPPTPAATPPPTPAATPPPTPEATPPPTATPLPAATPPTQEPTLPSPKTRTVIVKLRDLPNPADYLDDFALRFSSKYTPESLHDMAESQRLFGLLESPQIVRLANGRWDPVCGHRRIGGLHLNAKRGVPGFSLDMDVPCQEILDSSRLALLARSMTTNESGVKLDPEERLLAIQKLDSAGAVKKEIAVIANVSEKQIDRDLRVVRNPRVLNHVLKHNWPPSIAASIVEVAKGRLGEFLDYFDQWALEKADQIEAEDLRAKQETGRGLPPARMVVASRLQAHVVQGWRDALAKGKPLVEERELGFQATFDKRNAVATIKVKVDARNDSVEHLARVAGQVSQVAKHLAAFAQKRSVLEAPMGAQDMLQRDDNFLDQDLLAQFGLEGVIDLETEVPAEDNLSAEPTPEDNQNDATSGTN